MPRRHVAGVACFQLVVQALHQLILGSGGDYLHACLYTRILTRTAKENYSSRAYIDVRPVRIAFCGAKPCKTSYYSRVYIHIRPGVIAFCGAKPCRKNSPRGGFFIFFKQPQCLAPAGQSWAEAGSGVTARNWSSPASSGPRGSGPKRRGAACWTAPGHGSRTERRRGCLRGCRTCCI